MNRRDFIKMGTVAGASGGLHAAERQVVYGNVQKRWGWTATNLRLIEKGHRIAWIDNDKIIFAGSEVLESAETFGIYIWDFKKKAATSYAKLDWQDYDLFFHEGQVAYRPVAPKKTKTHVPWMIGKIGEEQLEWIPWSESVLSPKLWPAMGPGRRLVRDAAAKRNYLSYALRAEHGRLEIGSAPTGSIVRENPESQVRLMTSDGREMSLPILNKELFGVQDFHYLHHLNRYLILPSYPKDLPYGKPLDGRERQVAYLLSPSGNVEVVDLSSKRLITYVEATQAGLIAVAYTHADDPRDAGGWLQSSSGREVKLFEYPLDALGVSPDGARLAYAVNTQDPNRFKVNVVEMISF